MVHGHANLHFIQADAERPVDADAVVGRQQQEGALGHGMSGAGDDHRERVGQQATGEGGTGGHQADGFLGAGGHHFQIVATGEDARLAGDDHHRAVAGGLVQGGVEGGNHVRGNGIDLAIAQGQGRDTVFEMVGDQFTHDVIPYKEVAQTLPSRTGEVKRRD